MPAGSESGLFTDRIIAWSAGRLSMAPMGTFSWTRAMSPLASCSAASPVPPDERFGRVTLGWHGLRPAGLARVRLRLGVREGLFSDLSLVTTGKLLRSFASATRTNGPWVPHLCLD